VSPGLPPSHRVYKDHIFNGCVGQMNPKKKAILDRIKHLEDAIAKAREYLESRQHAHWHGFRALFVEKVRDGKVLPPHRDWVKNVFLPSQEKALRRAEKILEKMNQVGYSSGWWQPQVRRTWGWLEVEAARSVASVVSLFLGPMSLNVTHDVTKATGAGAGPNWPPETQQ